MGRLKDALAHAWNVFINDETQTARKAWGSGNEGVGYGVRPDRVRMRVSNERSIIASIYNRIGIDVAQATFNHVRVDENGRYVGDIQSELNNCLTVEANLDQAATAFRQAIAMTIFDQGVLAVVPVTTTLNPELTGSYDIRTMRVGRIREWKPLKVKVELYDERDGKKKELYVDKANVAIIENPLYTVMNEPNSTLQRLIRKLNQLDAIDEQISSGKLDLIIQLPYVIKTEAKRNQANERRRDIEMQLSGSKYGIAYTDGTEKVTQLNRPAENNLMAQVEYLTKMLYGQLGVTEEVLNGTADDQVMQNYHARTVRPILIAISEEFKRKFLTRTARTQGQSIMFWRDPFIGLSLKEIGAIIDPLMRNTVVTANEVRPWIGMKPSSDPEADKLVNKNMPHDPPADPTADVP